MNKPCQVQLRLPPGHDQTELIREAARLSGYTPAQIKELGFRILRQSVDARRKPHVMLQYTLEIAPLPLELQGVRSLLPDSASRAVRHDRPVVVGCGPAGLFAGLLLALAGRQPLLLERGEPVELRARTVQRFWRKGQLNPDSNVQFGEGGAGTFSDGKLTTGIKNHRVQAIFEELVLAGAPEEILFLARPHVGTDRLRQVVRSLREKILAAGGNIQFNSQLVGLVSSRQSLQAIMIRQKQDETWVETELNAGQVILATGHSARDTYTMLKQAGISLEPKPFSIGFRIEHPQNLINRVQYGDKVNPACLPAAEYKLACHLPGGRSAYTFCMCPGGQVIASASENEALVINGMSYHARSGRNSNSALLVAVDPADFPYPGSLGGMLWQRELEQKAYQAGRGGYCAPVQAVTDYLGPANRSQVKAQSVSSELLQPTYQPGVTYADLHALLPDWMNRALAQALLQFDHRLPGFAAAGIMTAVETRSSAPLRIRRNQQLQSSLTGLYPCGEGAGYAGGIISAAADGLRCAEAVLLQ